MRLREFRMKTLGVSRAKVVYTRITLNPYTLVYFLLAFISCIILVVLQAITFADNTKAVALLSNTISKANVTQGLPVIIEGTLQYCDRLPDQQSARCTPVTNSSTGASLTGNNGGQGSSGTFLDWKRHTMPVHVSNRVTLPDSHLHYHLSRLRSSRALLVSHGIRIRDTRHAAYDVWRLKRGIGNINSNALASGATPPNKPPITKPTSTQNQNCAKALRWLQERLGDERREDIVTLCYYLWLFSLSLVTILSESLPHLGAGLLGHIFSTAWTAYRVSSSYHLMQIYQGDIIMSVCNNVDPLADWWKLRNEHAIPILMANATTLAIMLFLSYKLYKIYNTQTFALVGPSPGIERMLKFVLLFYVSLQLTGFMTLASSAIWIDKVTRGNIRYLARHIEWYLAAFVIILILVLPWLFLGWKFIRRECKWRFVLFCIISVILLTTSTVMFWSALYRFIFTTWPFFATITVTAYIFVIISSILAIWCRFKFGQGLAHYLQVSSALESIDFPPVYFSKEGDTESGSSSPTTRAGAVKHNTYTIAFPTTTRQDPAPAPPRDLTLVRNSVFTSNNWSTLKLSSSLPLFSEMAGGNGVENGAGPAPSMVSTRTPSVISSATRRMKKQLYRKSGMSVKQLSLLVGGSTKEPRAANNTNNTRLDGNDDTKNDGVNGDGGIDMIGGNRDRHDDVHGTGDEHDGAEMELVEIPTEPPPTLDVPTGSHSFRKSSGRPIRPLPRIPVLPSFESSGPISPPQTVTGSRGENNEV
ncbi:hypothetical protein AMATHDRAFT_63440 [Amanita thiersii Skay4041]|uniref:Uncharacterized protein n=1 Tax=Amanita thiersii Skay4041 TaxID=703135 RepID=A0A2A9NM21_9AGAR|nr:hypothetical protein AMATHDRAFT_63440 [Amanita thiersii Skay4041]